MKIQVPITAATAFDPTGGSAFQVTQITPFGINSTVKLRNAVDLSPEATFMLPVSLDEGFKIIEEYRRLHSRLVILGTVRDGLAFSPAMIASTSQDEGRITVGLLDRAEESGCTCEFSTAGAKMWINPTGAVSRKDSRHLWKSSVRIQLADGAELILGEPSAQFRISPTR